jgi:hypothetical protein
VRWCRRRLPACPKLLYLCRGSESPDGLIWGCMRVTLGETAIRTMTIVQTPSLTLGSGGAIPRGSRSSGHCSIQFDLSTKPSLSLVSRNSDPYIDFVMFSCHQLRHLVSVIRGRQSSSFLSTTRIVNLKRSGKRHNTHSYVRVSAHVGRQRTQLVFCETSECLIPD